MGISPRPRCSGWNAFPITAPNALSGSATFTAFPGVGGRQQVADLYRRPHRLRQAVNLADQGHRDLRPDRRPVVQD